MKKLTIQICNSILRPLAAVLLRCGLTWKEFADISKAIYVDVASREFGIRGRPTNVSRISILTGIQRKEVSRLRDLLRTQKNPEPEKTTDATRLLSGWHADPDYLNAAGQPRPLSMDGPSPNFADLFARYGGDTPQQTMLRELKNATAIEINAHGQVIALSRYFMPMALSEPNLRIFGRHLSSHAHTLQNNIVHQSSRKPWFEGAAIDENIRPDDVEAFREFINARGQQFLEEVDDWLIAHRQDTSNENSVSVRLGAGIYAINGNS